MNFGKRVFSNDSIKYCTFYLILLLMTIPVTGAEIFSSDLWKSLYTGRYIALFGQFPHHSTFSFSPVNDFWPRYSFNWLGDLTFFYVLSFTDLSGLQLFRALLTATGILACHKIVNYRVSPVVLLLLSLMVYGASQKLILRNAIIAFPMLSITLSLLLNYYRKRKLSILLWLVPCFLIWSNFHGSYMVGLGFLGIFVIGFILDQYFNQNSPKFDRSVKLSLLFVTCLIVSSFVKPFPDLRFFERLEKIPERAIKIANPRSQTSRVVSNSQVQKQSVEEQISSRNHTKDNNSSAFFIISSIRNTIFKPRPTRSQEYMNPWSRLDLLFVKASAIIILLGLVMLVIDTITRAGMNITLWLLYIASVVIGIGYLRTLPYVAIVTVPIILFILGKATITSFKPMWNNLPVPLVVTGILSIAFGIISHHVVAGTTGKLMGNPYHTLGIGTSNVFSEKIAIRVRQDYKHDRIYNEYGIGGFLIWHWWPLKKVFWDSKQSIYEDKFIRAVIKQPLPKTLKSHDISKVLLTKFNPWLDNYFNLSKKWSVTLHRQDMIFLKKRY